MFERLKRHAGPIALVAYAGAIYAANFVTEKYGAVSVAGMYVMAGTVFAGASLMLRNVIQDECGRLRVFLAILGGAVLSFATSPALAVASAVAFGIAELADMGVYTPLRKRGWIRAVLPASFVGAVLDTAIFLKVAGFPVWDNLTGQVIGKLLATLVPVLLVWLIRDRRVQ